MLRRRSAICSAAMLGLALAAGPGRAQYPDGTPVSPDGTPFFPGGMPPFPGGMPLPPDGMFPFNFGDMAGPGGNGGPPLITYPAIQKELGLTDKQKGKLKSIQANSMERIQGALAEAGEEGVNPQEMMAEMNAVRRNQDAAAAKILDARQKTRLSQIELQRDGLLALARPDVASKVGLTPAQSTKVQAIADGIGQAVAQAMAGGPVPPGGPGAPAPKSAPKQGGPAPSPPEMADPATAAFQAQFARLRGAMGRARASAIQEIGDVLTPDQKAAHARLLGEPFDLASLRPGPGVRPAGAPTRADGRARSKATTKTSKRP